MVIRPPPLPKFLGQSIFSLHLELGIQLPSNYQKKRKKEKKKDDDDDESKHGGGKVASRVQVPPKR